ncbi:MAG TPA: phosphoglycolate phosphatase [Steroidobacteraceae bacterium]|nr:phosphoglycolate phosphatase [Steroidobacteraceae bacterium]
MSRVSRAVLFDLDGTLLDTAHDLAQALNELRREESLAPLPFERIRNFVSHGSSALVRIGFPEAAEAQFLALRERLLEIYRAALAVYTVPFEGMLELLTRLEREGVPWGIVTNKPAFLTEPLLEQLALHRRAGVIVSGDTLPERKPHPAPLLYAARALGVSPDSSVYVGDAERDVLAARAAGMRALVACFGYIGPEETPRAWPADAWVDSPLEIYRWLQGAGYVPGSAGASVE